MKNYSVKSGTTKNDAYNCASFLLREPPVASVAGIFLIVFTITNKVTGKVYVGSTRNDLMLQWEKIIAAAELKLDFPLYREIRAQGAESFTVEEWDYTDDRQELMELEREALVTLKAESLRGYKTSVAGEKTVESKTPRKKAAVRRSTKSTQSQAVEVEVEVKVDDGQPLKHVNAGGESVVRFDRKTTTVADAISGIGNRTPEHTYLHPLRRVASITTESTAAESTTQSDKTAAETPDVSDTLITQASNIESITSSNETAKRASVEASVNSDSVLSDAMSMLKNLQRSDDELTEKSLTELPGHQCKQSNNGTGNAVFTESAHAEAAPAEPSLHQQRTMDAVDRQRQQLINRCNEQQKLQKQKLEERINALESLAQEKMGRLSNAA